MNGSSGDRVGHYWAALLTGLTDLSGNWPPDRLLVAARLRIAVLACECALRRPEHLDGSSPRIAVHGVKSLGRTAHGFSERRDESFVGLEEA